MKSVLNVENQYLFQHEKLELVLLELLKNGQAQYEKRFVTMTFLKGMHEDVGTSTWAE
jgi:hypothetical protein